MAERIAINSMMGAIISGTCNGLESACSVIADKWGREPNKGLLSKKLNMNADWTIADLMALEDHAGRYPITRMLHRRIGRKQTNTDNLSLLTGSAAKEAGEALQAALAAIESEEAGNTAEAIREADEAARAFDRLRDRLEAGVSGVN